MVERLRPEYWRAWRELRLRALAESPDAFGSTYEENLRVTAQTWQRRARAFAVPAGDRAMFVAIDQARGEWIGCAGAHVDPGGIPNLISMWVAPEHRGRGVGSSLVGAVIGWARAPRRCPGTRTWWRTKWCSGSGSERSGRCHAEPVS